MIPSASTLRALKLKEKEEQAIVERKRAAVHLAECLKDVTPDKQLLVDQFLVDNLPKATLVSDSLLRLLVPYDLLDELGCFRDDDTDYLRFQIAVEEKLKHVNKPNELQYTFKEVAYGIDSDFYRLYISFT
jgi:hypothetical protein